MKSISSLLAVTVCLAVAAPAFAGGGYGGPSACAGCGCKAPCRKVCCQIVCDYEDVEVDCWDVKCEDYCLPIPVLGSGLGRSKSCGACRSCSRPGGSCQCGKCEPDVACGHPRVKKTLMLRTVKVKKPVYKCVTKYLCGACQADAAGAPGSARVREASPAPQAVPLPPVSRQVEIPNLQPF